ncbi:hypothetical protein BC832DRAFT_542868 [Gaertneriomyces semiglobifer]|nr:hypothetical protein BC832DRAFT_542868 [Gaertneriomyces semiglobifer]
MAGPFNVPNVCAKYSLRGGNVWVKERMDDGLERGQGSRIACGVCGNVWEADRCWCGMVEAREGWENLWVLLGWFGGIRLCMRPTRLENVWERGLLELEGNDGIVEWKSVRWICCQQTVWACEIASCETCTPGEREREREYVQDWTCLDNSPETTRDKRFARKVAIPYKPEVDRVVCYIYGCPNWAGAGF